jgi:hypothetical protein
VKATRAHLVALMGLTRELTDQLFERGLLMMVDPGDPTSLGLFTQEDADVGKWGPEVQGQKFWRCLIEGEAGDCIAWLLEQVAQSQKTHELADL